MSRKCLIISALILLALGIAAVLVTRDDSTVYFRTVEEPSEAFDASRIDWLATKDGHKGVHLYALEPGLPYELLVYDNTYRGENRYLTSTMSASLRNGVLRIDFADKDAVDDGYVNDKVLAYFIIKEKPGLIEVYRNGQKEQYEMETGSGPITR